MNNNKFTSLIFPSVLIFLTFSAFTNAQETTSPVTGLTPDIHVDPCKDIEVADCSICPCPQLSSRFSEWMLAIAGLLCALSFMFIIFMRLIKQIREKPGDLVLGSILAQIVFSLTIIVEKIGFPRVRTDEGEADASCLAFGLLKTISAALINFYMITFFAVHLLSIKNYMKSSRVKSRYLHAAAFLITALLTAVLLLWRTIGVNTDGTCGMTSTPAILGPIVGYAALAAFGLYLVYLSKKNLSARESLNRMQEDFLKHYMICLIVISNLFLIAGITAFISDVMAVSESLDGRLAHIFSFIQFVLLNVCTLMLIITRLSDPVIGGHVKKYLKRCLCWWNDDYYEDGEAVSSEEGYTSPESFNDDIRIDMQKIVPVTGQTGLLQGSHRIFDTPQEDTLERDKKTNMISSVLISIAYFWKMNHLEIIKKKSEDEDDMIESYRRGASRRNIKEISVQEGPLKKLVPQVFRELKRRGKKLMTGFFTVFQPETFQRLIEHDDVLLELKDAWEFVSNYGNVLSYGYQVDEFGKMFFLSSNGKYVLQEISTQEKRIILSALPNYVGHLRAHPESLLARIYGLFTFETHDMSRQVHMIIVKNIGECGWRGIEKQYKLRGYAMEESRKGSLKGGYTPLTERDFERQERNLHLDTASKDTIMETLGKDINFLESNSLGNYALQVSFVNKEKFCRGMVSSSVIIEVDETSDLSGSMNQTRDGDLLFQRDLDELEKEDSQDNVKTYVGVVDFWRDTLGKRTSFVWQTLKSLRSSKFAKSEGNADMTVKHGDTFLKYVDSILV